MTRMSNPVASYSKASALGHSLPGQYCLPGESINWAWLGPLWTESSSIRLPEPVPLPETDPNLIPKIVKAKTLKNFYDLTVESLCPFST